MCTCGFCALRILIFIWFENEIVKGLQLYIWEVFENLHAYELKFIVDTVLLLSITDTK